MNTTPDRQLIAENDSITDCLFAAEALVSHLKKATSHLNMTASNFEVSVNCKGSDNPVEEDDTGPTLAQKAAYELANVLQERRDLILNDVKRHHVRRLSMQYERLRAHMQHFFDIPEVKTLLAEAEASGR